MGIFTDTILLGPISLIYYFIISIISDYYVRNQLYKQKRNNKFLILYISGLLSIIGAFKVFPMNELLQLTPIKYGILTAGLALSVNSSISYWYEMDHKTKLFVLIVCLLASIFGVIQLKQDSSIDYHRIEKEKKNEEELKEIEEEIERDSYENNFDI
jgi:uncharacterized membrane protein YfcA